MRKPKSGDETRSDQYRLAELRRMVEAVAARCSSTPDAAESGGRLEPETEAEGDLFRLKMSYELQSVICAHPRRCARHRCRRLGSCPELDDIKRLIEQARARLAREREADAEAAGERNH